MSIARWIREKWPQVLFFVSAFFIVLVAGFVWAMLAVELEIWPMKHVRDIRVAAKAQYHILRTETLENDETLPLYRRFEWYGKTDEKTAGVVINKPEKTWGDYTLFSRKTTEAELIDMDGNVVHSWSKPYYDVFPNPDHLIDPKPERNQYFRKTHLLPGGELLVVYEGMNQSPYGGGLAKLSRDSELIWRYKASAHHDLDVAPDGRVYVLTHEYRRDGGTVVDDYLVILSPDGEELEKIHLLDALRKSFYATLIEGKIGGDYLHTNTVNYVTADVAADYPQFNEGDILLSHREPNLITVMDGETHIIKWALGKIPYHQHDPDLEPGGWLYMFDNRGGRFVDGVRYPKGEYSRILKYNFRTSEVSLAYADPGEFYTKSRGSQQVLNNGNILITESGEGTLFEVSPDQEVVWKYVDKTLNGNSIGVVCWGQRFSADELPWLNDMAAR